MIRRNPEVATQPLFFGKNRLCDIMKKVKLLLKNHWKILLFELVFIVLYVGFSICIDRYLIQNVTILSIIFSAEFFVAMIVGVAAVYSWIYHKKVSDLEITDAKYNSDLHLLQNIDELLEVYRNKGEERAIGDELQIFLEGLEETYKNKDMSEPRNKFLDIYYRFLSDKTSPDQDNLDIKTKISRELGVNKKNIRYSKNYENDAKRDNLKWTTWFTLSENTIDDLEVDDNQIFITNVDGKDIIFQIRGKDLKDMISEGKIRKRLRAGKTVYDFFFGQDFKENFVEGKRKIDLGKYNIEILSDSKVLNNE
ncbi:hypothetical protein D8872_04135 [Streptococcus cristatus]|uniref:Uncharacterized protein n=2 Tax=Streptococcus cristatus TaxID=45634 RepID=A0A428AMN1_STRCR|nr:hypothetical protein D8872_04135 [Streptococcus cristatus]